MKKQNFNRALSLLLVLGMLCGLLCTTAYADSVRIDGPASSSYAGDGSTENPYLVLAKTNSNTPPSMFWGTTVDGTSQIGDFKVVFEGREGETQDGDLIYTMGYDLKNDRVTTLDADGTGPWDGKWTYAFRLAIWTEFDTSTGDLRIAFPWKGEFAFYWNSWTYSFDAVSLTKDLDADKQLAAGDSVEITYYGGYLANQTSRGTNYTVDFTTTDDAYTFSTTAVVGEDGFVTLEGDASLPCGGNYIVTKVESESESGPKTTTIDGVEYLVFDSAEDMEWLRAHVQAGGDVGGYCTHNVILASDIDMTGYYTGNGADAGIGVPQSWLGYSGIFDGAGHTISNISIANTQTVGPKGLLFNLTQNATVKNVVIQGELNSNRFTGGVVGRALGSLTLENVVLDATLTLSNGASNSVGGLIGQMGSGQTTGGETMSIENCVALGTFTSATSSNPVGGLVGHIYSGFDVDIVNSYAAADLSCAGGTTAGLIANQATNDLTITNSYYLDSMGDACGTNSGVGTTIEATAVTADYMQSSAFLNALGEAFKMGEAGYPVPVTIITAEPEPAYAASVTSGDTVANYETLTDAIASAGAGDTVTLLADVTESVTIPANADIILELNGKTLTGTEDDTVTNSGTLVIQDSVGGGAMISSGFDVVWNTGSLTIKSGTMTYVGEDGYTVGNAGGSVLTVEGGTIEATGVYGFGICNYQNGIVTIKGGTVNSTYYYAISSSGTVVIEDGVFAAGEAYVISAQGSYIQISGGTYNKENICDAATYLADGYEVVANGDGTYTVRGVEEPEPELFDIDGANMTLGNELAMNFFINKAELASDVSYYAAITKTYADGRDDVVVTIPDSEWTSYNADYYYVAFDGVAAKEMTDAIYVQVFQEDGTAASNLWTDSVRDYAMRILENQSDKAKTMLVDMLNYGAAAQTYFGYAAEDLANSQLTDAQKAYATVSVTCTDSRVTGDNYVGSTLTLGNNIAMTYYFNIASTDGMYAVATFTDHYGNEQSVTIQGSDFIRYNSTANYWGPTINELVVADARQAVTCTVYNADGTVYGTVTDSVESYIARMSSTDLLYSAIMKFSVSAYDYLHDTVD